MGRRPVDNDDALDFLAELSDLPPDELGRRIAAALALPVEGYLELPEASAAIAAVGLIAVGSGAAFDDLDEEAIELAQSDEVRDPRLKGLALTALARVSGEASEWRELWSESESSAEAEMMIAGLRSALA